MSAFIRTHQLTLDVPIFLQREREAKGWGGMFLGAAFDPPKRRLARLLEGIDLDVGEGDRLAILGRNGAGKSTLLRVLNRVYRPTSGTILTSGSCQALLNMSLGFNGEATVRENVFLRGVAMGLRSAFLREQMDSILEFSGLQRKSTHRLRTLSSGQKMRLGFAISTSVQHDIILMDEWVGAGDAEFMAKAKERMRSRVSGSKIVVLASHSTGLLRDICNKGIVLEGGRLAYSGDISGALKHYHGLMARVQAGQDVQVEAFAPKAGHVFGAIEEITSTGAEGSFRLKGWMVDNQGATPSALVIEWNGQRFAVDALERVRRPDVMKHFGLLDDACGFVASVVVPGTAGLPDLGGGMLRVLGGETTEQANGPLRIAATVLSSIGMHEKEHGITSSRYHGNRT